MPANHTNILSAVFTDGMYFEIYCIHANNTVYNETFAKTFVIMVVIVIINCLGGYLS